MTTQVSPFSIVILLLIFGSPLRAQESKAAPTVTLAQLSQLIGGPTRITLHFKNAAPEVVFAEVARQAGVTIDTSALGAQGNIPSVPISIDVERQPFWQVFRTLGSRLNIDPDIYGTVIKIERPGARSLERGPISDQGLASDQGLVLVVADSSARSSDLSYSAPGPRKQSRRLNLILLVDPKLRLLDESPPLKLETVADEAGRTIFEAATPSLVLGSPFGISSELLYGSDSQPVQTSQSSASRRMPEVKGTARLFVGFNIERWEVPDILAARNVVRVVKRAGGPSRYTVQDVVTTDTNYEVHLTISKREFDLEDQFATYARFEGRVHLFDGQGHEFPQDQSHVRTSNDFSDSVSLVVPFKRKSEDGDRLFHVAELGTPQKLVIEIPDIRAVEMPVEFRNLPLP